MLACGCEPSPPGAGPTSAPAEARTKPAPAPALFPSVGSSDEADPLAAAAAAAQQALGKCTEAGIKPVAAIFLERTGASAADGAKIGDKVRRLVGVPTYGHGSARGDSPAPSVSVLLLAGDGLSVTAYAAAGEVPHDDREDAADAARVRALRRACTERGESLGKQVPKAARDGLLVVLGAMGGDWHANFFTGLHRQLGAKVGIVGGVGAWGDYVYVDGRQLVDSAGGKTAVGQLALAIRGRFRFAAETVTFTNAWDDEAAGAEAQAAWAAVGRRLAPARPKLALAFGPAAQLKRAAGPDSDMPVFGCPCTGQAGTGVGGELSAGVGRLVLCEIAAE